MGETLDYLQSLYNEHKKPELEFNSRCHDCGKEVKVITTLADDGKLTVEGGGIYKIVGINKPFFKCPVCLEKNPTLTNYQPCEIYSRVTGYLAPFHRWNKGKKEEFKMRTGFKVS